MYKINYKKLVYFLVLTILLLVIINSVEEAFRISMLNFNIKRYIKISFILYSIFGFLLGLSNHSIGQKNKFIINIEFIIFTILFFLLASSELYHIRYVTNLLEKITPRVSSVLLLFQIMFGYCLSNIVHIKGK